MDVQQIVMDKAAIQLQKNTLRHLSMSTSDKKSDVITVLTVVQISMDGKPMTRATVVLIICVVSENDSDSTASSSVLFILSVANVTCLGKYGSH